MRKVISQRQRTRSSLTHVIPARQKDYRAADISYFQRNQALANIDCHLQMQAIESRHYRLVTIQNAKYDQYPLATSSNMSM